MLSWIIKNQTAFFAGFLILLCVVIGNIEPKFWSLINVFDILRNYASWGIFTVGQTVVLIAGGIDVSFTAIATTAMYLVGILMINRAINSILIAFVLAGSIGCILGLLNGIFVYVCKVHPVIITIATLNVYYNLLIHFTRGRWLYNLPRAYLDFGLVRVFNLQSAGQPTGLSLLTIFWVLIALLTWLWLRHTSIGRKLYAMGGNPEAACRLGVNVFNLQLLAYSYAGALAGIGGFIYGAAAQFIQPNALVGRELDVIAAAILGGASIFGGKGSALTSVLGMLLIGIIRNALILLKIPSYWHAAVIGGVIMGATLLTAYQVRIVKSIQTRRIR